MPFSTLPIGSWTKSHTHTTAAIREGGTSQHPILKFRQGFNLWRHCYCVQFQFSAAVFCLILSVSFFSKDAHYLTLPRTDLNGYTLLSLQISFKSNLSCFPSPLLFYCCNHFCMLLFPPSFEVINLVAGVLKFLQTPGLCVCLCVCCEAYFLQRDLIYILSQSVVWHLLTPCYPLSPWAGESQPFPSKHIISMPVLSHGHVFPLLIKARSSTTVERS